MRNSPIPLILLLFLIFFHPVTTVFAQKDSSKTNLSFDIGWTRDKNNLNLWPFARVIKTKDIKDIQILFPIYINRHDYRKSTKYSHLFPLYWSDSNSSGHDFRFLSLYYPSLIHSSLSYPKNIYSFKFLELAPDIEALEFSRSKDGLFIQNNFLFFLWYKNDQYLKKSYMIVFPVSWYYNQPGKFNYTFFPLLTTGRNELRNRKYTVVTPFYWHLENSYRSFSTVFPIYWNRKIISPENRATTNVVFPLYWSFVNQKFKRTIFFPLLWLYKSPDYNKMTIFPLYSAGRNRLSNNGYRMITPFYWHFDNTNNSSTTLFPIYWKNTVFSGSKKGSSLVLFPLYWNFESPNSNKTIFFPLLWVNNNQSFSRITIFPIYSSGKDYIINDNYRMITPLYWHFSFIDGYSNYLFPIWWQTKSKTGDDEKKSNIIFPLWYSTSKNGGHIASRVLFPFIWTNCDYYKKTFTFFPLFSFGSAHDSTSKYLYIAPLYIHKYERGKYTPEKISSTFFPLWWYSRNDSGFKASYSYTLFPLFWYRKANLKKNLVIFPLLWNYNNQYHRSITLLPLFSYGYSKSKANSHFAITPFFWYFKRVDGSTKLLFPLWLSNTDYSIYPEHEEIVFPIYWSFINSYHKNDIVFPIYWSFHNYYHNNKVWFPFLWNLKYEYYQSFTFFPFYSKGKSTDGFQGHYAITALFWHFYEQSDYSNTLFPVWWYRHTYRKGISNVIFPIYWHYKNSKGSKTVIFPLIWDMKTKFTSSFTFLPLFYSGVEYSFYNADETKEARVSVNKRYQVFFPIYWSASRKSGKQYHVLFPVWWNNVQVYRQDTFSSNVIFPLYWSYKNNFQKSKILFPLLWSVNNVRYHSVTFVPLFSYGHSHNNDDAHQVISPFYWHFRYGDQNSHVLFPLYWRSVWKNGSHKNVIFPLWWNSLRYTGNDTFSSIVLFPLYWSYKNDYQKSTVLFPIFWKLSNPRYYSITAIPLFSFGHSYDNTKSHLVISPLYWQFKSGSRQNKLFIPLILSTKNEHSHSFTFLPLFSVGKSQDNQKKYFVVTPLYWHFKKPESQISTLIPVFYYKKSISEGKRFSLFYFLLRFSAKGEKSTFSLAWPICESDKDVNYSYFRLFPIIWYKKTPGTYMFSIQPFWYYHKDSLYSSKRIFTELYVRKNYYNTMISNNILWKLAYWSNYQNGDFETRIFYLLYANVKKEGSIEKSYFPFYYYSLDKNGNKNSFSLFLLL